MDRSKNNYYGVPVKILKKPDKEIIDIFNLSSLGPKPSVLQIAKAIGFSEEGIMLMKQALYGTYSLDRKVSASENGDLTIGNTISSQEKTEEKIVNELVFSEVRDCLLSCCNEYLSEKEYKVITMFFGLGGCPKTPKEISKEVKTSISKVIKIKQEAIEKLKLMGGRSLSKYLPLIT